MYRCNTCIYKKACQGAHGTKTCDGYVLDNKQNRAEFAKSAADREEAFVQYLNNKNNKQ